MSAMDEEQKRRKGWGVDRERRKRERANLRSGKIVAGEILLLGRLPPPASLHGRKSPGSASALRSLAERRNRSPR